MKTFQRTVGYTVTIESILGEPEMLSAPYEFILSTDREDTVNAEKKSARSENKKNSQR